MTPPALTAPPPGTRPIAKLGPPPSAMIQRLTDSYTRPGMLSTLRRAMRQLPRVEDHTIWPYLGNIGRSNAQQDSAVLTACLWAHYHSSFHAPRRGEYSIGAAMRRAVDRDQQQKRWNVLAVSDWPTLCSVLPALVGDIAKANVGIDWDQTHRDLTAIRTRPTGRENVMRRWSAGLFSPPEAILSTTYPTPPKEDA